MTYRAQPNPTAGKFVKPDGYDDLGWQVWQHPKQIACRDAKHRTHEFDNSLFKFRCTDVVTICDECKYVYHTDMSD